MEEKNQLSDVDRAQLAQLVNDAKELNAGLGRLTGETDTTLVGLAKRGKSARRWISWLAISLVLDLVLTVVLGFVIQNGQSNTERLDKLSASLRTQLCGELAIFVNADTPQASAAAKARGDDPKVRAKAFQIIRQSYAALRCAEFVH